MVGFVGVGPTTGPRSVSVVFMPSEACAPSGHQSLNEPPPRLTVIPRVAPGGIIGVVFAALIPGPEIDRRCAILPALWTTSRTVPAGRLFVEQRDVVLALGHRDRRLPRARPAGERRSHAAAPASARATTTARAMTIRFTTPGIRPRGRIGFPVYAAVAEPADCSAGGAARSISTVWPRRQRNRPCCRSRSSRPANVEPVEPSAASSSAQALADHGERGGGSGDHHDLRRRSRLIYAARSVNFA